MAAALLAAAPAVAQRSLGASRRSLHSAAGGQPLRGLQDAVVVPLPGALLTSELFSRVGCLAAALGARTVDAELGEEAARSSVDLPALARRVVEGFDTRHGPDARTVLVGHSYGGYAALEFASRWPGRLAGLVLISTQCRADTPGAIARREEQITLLRTQGLNAVLDRVLPSMLSSASLSDPSVLETVHAMAHSVGAEVFERQVRACASRADHRETLRRLPETIPVLAISGKEDRLTPPTCMREINELLAQREQAAQRPPAPWRCSGHGGSGHLVPLEQPVLLRETMASWAEEVSAFDGAAWADAAVAAPEALPRGAPPARWWARRQGLLEDLVCSWGRPAQVAVPLRQPGVSCERALGFAAAACG